MMMMVMMMKLDSLPKPLLSYDVINQGIKLQVEPTGILFHGNSRIIL